jgi:uncharacterized tellurite resistance protein B-like protein
MKISDVIYEKTGVSLNLDNLSDDPEGQLMTAALLAEAGHSDGGISPDETTRIVELICGRFGVHENEAISLLVNGLEKLAEEGHYETLLSTLNDRFTLEQKEDLLVMALEVVAADGRKEASELQFISVLIDDLSIPEAVVKKAYNRYFQNSDDGEK